MNTHFYFDEIFKRIQTVTHTRTQMELAQILEIRQSSISDAKRRNAIPADWYLKLFEKLGVSPDWLKKGTGPIYLRTEAGYIPSEGDGICINPDLLGNPLAQSCTYHSLCHARRLYKNTTFAAELQPVDKISLPKTYAKEGTIVLEVDSDAAAPTVRRGAHIGIAKNSRTEEPLCGKFEIQRGTRQGTSGRQRPASWLCAVFQQTNLRAPLAWSLWRTPSERARHSWEGTWVMMRKLMKTD